MSNFQDKLEKTLAIGGTIVSLFALGLFIAFLVAIAVVPIWDSISSLFR